MSSTVILERPVRQAPPDLLAMHCPLPALYRSILSLPRGRGRAGQQLRARPHHNPLRRHHYPVYSAR